MVPAPVGVIDTVITLVVNGTGPTLENPDEKACLPNILGVSLINSGNRTGSSIASQKSRILFGAADIPFQLAPFLSPRQYVE